MISPSRCIAARWAPRAMNATACEAAASLAPKNPPTAPAPMIAIRMVELLFVETLLMPRPDVNSYRYWHDSRRKNSRLWPLWWNRRIQDLAFIWYETRHGKERPAAGL